MHVFSFFTCICWCVLICLCITLLYFHLPSLFFTNNPEHNCYPLFSGSVVEVFSDEEDFRGIFFQDNMMRTVFNSYPEVLLFDATYKLTELRMPLYLLMAIDGNGHSEIVGLYLTVSETATSLQGMLQAFKKMNSAWQMTTVVMTDKDLTERKTLSEEFPDAALQLCLFHTLRSFKRKFSLDKFGLCPGTRDTVLEILGKMANAKSPHLFNEQYEALKNLGVRAAIDFFEKN